MKSTSHEQVLANERKVLDLSDEKSGSALSISGGGIRSATFALGALQGLSKRGLLKQFDYLSTVSGGGYIGSWLTAWKQRRGGLDEVSLKLTQTQAPHSHSEDSVDCGIEPKEISYLRRYSNYLTPKLGVTSFDFWAIIATVIRNILVNWSVLIPALMSVLFLPRLYLAFISLGDHFFFSVIYPTGSISGEGHYKDPHLDCLGESFVIARILPLLAIVCFAVAQANILRYLPGSGGIKHSRRDYLYFILLPLVLSIFFLDAWNNLHFVGNGDVTAHWQLYALGSISALILALGGAMLTGLRINRRLFPVAAVTFLVPCLWAWVVYDFILWNNNDENGIFNIWYWAQYTFYSPTLILLGASGSIMLMAGLTSNFLGEADREWLARANGGIILFVLGWLMISFAVLIAPNILLFLVSWLHESHELSMSGLLGFIGALLGWFVSRQGNTKNAPSKFKIFLTQVSTILFLLILAISLSLLTNALIEFMHKIILPLVSEYSCKTENCLRIFQQFSTTTGKWETININNNNSWWNGFHWTNHENIISTANPIVLLATAVLLLVMSCLTGILVNTNTFSLQGMYRNRLVRAYLGASNDKRDPNEFTGFDDADDVKLRDLDPAMKPYHVVNMALNLVGGPRLEWQQRKAASFIASPLYCGNHALGYRDSASYGGPNGMSLGTAVATSGAAASPNMGYHSSPIMTFIMTLFNARLGIWLGNPKVEKAAHRASPTSALTSLIGEALGMTTDEGNYVYLSDGGHFENLALYEMVARHCSDILILDGGCDPSTAFEDLGNALRKINIDMGINIEFLPGHIDNIRNKTARYALAKIQYCGGQEVGRLIYVKPMLCGNESPSILSYATINPSFPHEDTSDQWFSESQTESYRLLGLTTILEITEQFPGTTLPQLYEWLRSKSCGDGENPTI